MRSFGVAFLAALCVPLVAFAKPVRQVEVTNLPAVQDVIGSVEVINLPSVQDVNVVDAPPPAAPTSFQLVGFTSQTYTGEMGGPFGVTLKCQLEFPESRMCSLEEIHDTTAIPGGLSGSAWSYSRDEGVLPNNQINCLSWRGTDTFGSTVSYDGAKGARALCSDPLPIACCAPVP